MIDRIYTPFRESYRTILTESAITCAQRLLMHFSETRPGRCVDEIARCASRCRYIMRGEK